MNGDRESREFVRRLTGRGRPPAPLPEGFGEAERTAELLQGNRAANEGKGSGQQRPKDYEMRRFAAELLGLEFRDERYSD